MNYLRKIPQSFLNNSDLILMKYAQVVELVDTLSWGGSGESRAGSSPALGTIVESLCQVS